jgi:hypothetical protein
MLLLTAKPHSLQHSQEEKERMDQTRIHPGPVVKSEAPREEHTQTQMLPNANAFQRVSDQKTARVFSATQKQEVPT